MPAPLSYHAEEWMTLALGAEAAAEAMALPTELRQELYHDILNYGPGGDLINEFCFRLNVVKKASTPELDNVANKVLNDMVVVGNKIQEKWDGSLLINDLNRWASDSNYEQLERTFHKATYTILDESRHSVMADGMNFCLWLLNGQYLFPGHLVESSQRCLPEMNDALALLGLDPLAGLLATTHEMEEQ